jgi:hypothetical protein
MASAASEALGGGAALTREELTAEIVGRTGSVVLHGGRVAGVWSDEGVTLWEDVPGPAVEAELSRQASLRALV